jgi:hypothetical protein
MVPAPRGRPDVATSMCRMEAAAGELATAVASAAPPLTATKCQACPETAVGWRERAALRTSMHFATQARAATAEDSASVNPLTPLDHLNPVPAPPRFPAPPVFRVSKARASRSRRRAPQRKAVSPIRPQSALEWRSAGSRDTRRQQPLRCTPPQAMPTRADSTWNLSLDLCWFGGKGRTRLCPLGPALTLWETEAYQNRRRAANVPFP